MKLSGEIQTAVEYLRKCLQDIFILDPIPIHMRDYCRLGDSLLPDGSNTAGLIAGLPATERKKTEDYLTQYVGELPDNPFERIYVELVGKFQQDAMLYGKERLSDKHVLDIDARSMSDGTLRIIAIITAILTRPQDSLLVIEEVDNGLHPSKAGFLLKSLLELGTERGIDILITTHNPALLDELGMELLPFISLTYRDKTTGYSGIRLLEDVETLPKLIGYGTLGRIVSNVRTANELFQ
jgi:AAA domain, putative AbiEii toxin, Type IV TA system